MAKKRIRTSNMDKATLYSAEIMESVRRKERKEGRPLFVTDETVVLAAEDEKPKFEPTGTVDIKKKDDRETPVFNPTGTVDIKKKEAPAAPKFEPTGTVDIKKKEEIVPEFKPKYFAGQSKKAPQEEQAASPKAEPVFFGAQIPGEETAQRTGTPKEPRPAGETLRFDSVADYLHPAPNTSAMPDGLRDYLERKRAEKEREEAMRAVYTSIPAPSAPPAPVAESAATGGQVKEAASREPVGSVSGKAPMIRSDAQKGSVVLKASGLTKRFGERVAVNNVSFEVFAGEIFGFLGPNGSGKTTTIRMICGLASITEGEAEICGISVKNDFKRAVSNIGGIIENPEMYKYMSGWDNMKYYASLYSGISDEQIMDVVRLVRMEKRIHEKVRRYSLGMRQRVGIAQSLLHNPKILLLDEPTNGLDPAGIHEMRDFLKMLAHERGIAVFISSHILTEMQLMCDRVGIVSNGNLVAVKTIDEWTDATEANKLIKLRVNDPAGAEKTLQRLAPHMEVKKNGGLLIFTLPHELLPILSLELAADKVSVLGLTIGEKTLEETFLELTGQGAAID